MPTEPPIPVTDRVAVREALISLLVDITQADRDAIGRAGCLRELNGWDSMSALELLLGFESRLGVVLDPEQFAGTASIDDVVALVIEARSNAERNQLCPRSVL
jgi:acyl carrier protein